MYQRFYYQFIKKCNLYFTKIYLTILQSLTPAVSNLPLLNSSPCKYSLTILTNTISRCRESLRKYPLCFPQLLCLLGSGTGNSSLRSEQYLRNVLDESGGITPFISRSLMSARWIGWDSLSSVGNWSWWLVHILWNFKKNVERCFPVTCKLSMISWK